MPQSDTLSPAVDENFSDIIVQYPFSSSDFSDDESVPYPSQFVDNQYSILHAPLSDNLAYATEIGYAGVPKLFTFIDTTSLESAGILAVQLQPYLHLSGEGVLIGFLDSGIDYTHPAFRNPDGTTRILGIWDQTDQSGPAPDGMLYGTEYTETAINEALFSAAPLSIVPEQDELGHGTAVAGIACGSPDRTADFTGAAPQSGIVFVKLKPAKQYLRNYFVIPEDATAYQESDLMLGVRYLINTARSLRMPLVICITLGTNQGGHTGTTPLEEVLTSAQFNTGIYAVTGTGNEVGAGHHYFGRLSGVEDYTDVELLVDAETTGFTLEFWANAPELYSIGFTSPLGEVIQPIQPRPGTMREIDFILESSKLYLDYFIVEMLSGSQLAQIRFTRPTPGVWRLRIVNKMFIDGVFHIWLPISGLVDSGIQFYIPNPDTTLVVPSCAEAVITTGTYNAYTNSMYLNSGRGYTRNNIVKPDFVTPGVDVSSPVPGGAFSPITGSCAASALAAGAVALLVESGLRAPVPRYFTVREIKGLIIRGTKRSSIYTYPNREWGYGVLDVNGIFNYFLQT